MFVQSAATTRSEQKNGVALRQRRGQRETLVQWANGQQRWVETSDLLGTVRLIDTDSGSMDYDSQESF